MASQPSGQLTAEPQPAQPTVISVPQLEAQSSSQARGAERWSPQPREADLPSPVNPATVSFPPNISVVTVNSADSGGRHETDIPQPPQSSQSQARLNRQSVVRPQTGRSRTSETVPGLFPLAEHWVYRTVEDRLDATLKHAEKERDAAERAANASKWSLNIVAGIQVLLGGLTTGLAAIRLEGKSLGIATTVLGILSTLAGAFLARVRATSEPEGALLRVHKLDAFIRECKAFCLDYGDDTTNRYKDKIVGYRDQLEQILTTKYAPSNPTTSKPGTVDAAYDTTKAPPLQALPKNPV